MGKHPQGFLLVTVLLALLIVTALGSVMLGSSSQDLRFAEREIESLQGEEIARSGIAYYLARWKGCKGYSLSALAGFPLKFPLTSPWPETRS